jgi:UrcA family protein
MKNLHLFTAVLAGSFGLGSAPLMAQSAPEEIVVTGDFGKVPDSVRSLSQSVSYADLDLSTNDGRAEIRRRVNLTARFLCDKLGESDTSSPLIPSCREAATRSAMARIGTLEENVAPRGTTWTRPPAWTPPYPAEWTTRYP